MTQADRVLSTLRADSPSKLSRRNMLAGLATLPALPAVVAAAEPDPIFALIEAKRAADMAHLAAIEGYCEAERRHGVDSEESNVAWDAGGPACHAASDAAWALASTPPTTLAGVLAVLKFVNELECGDWPEGVGIDEQLLETTAQAIEAIIGKGGAA